MAAVSALCSKAVLLRSGRLATHDHTSRVIAEYQSDRSSANATESLEHMPRSGTGKGRFRSLQIRATDEAGRSLRAPVPGSDVTIEVQIDCISDFNDTNVAVIVFDANGYRIIDVNTALHGDFLSLRAGQRATVRFQINDLLLKPAAYFVQLWLGRGAIEVLDYLESAGTLDIVEGASRPRHTENFPGVYQCRFTHECVVAE
jgi:homopolymeric O-antigen transport system ATP-binding protein